MAKDYTVISADSHVVEPHDLWQLYTVDRYRDRAPRLVHEADTDRLVCEGARLPPVGLLAGVMRGDDEVRAKGRWDEDVYPGGYDPDVRMEALARDGVDAEVLYPTIAMQLYPIVDSDFQWALFGAYNTWLSEFVAKRPDVFFGVAMLSPDDLDHCIRETQRAREIGLSGVMIPVIRGEGIPYWDDAWDPLWAAAVDHGMPVSLHAATSRDPEKRWDVKSAALSVLQTIEIEHVVLELIFAGVFDRFPDLKIVSAENDVGWAGHMLERGDYWFQRNRKLLKDIRCERPPSDYFHANVRATFMRDRTAVLAREVIGTDSMLWGNDFPHHVSTWPDSRNQLDAQFAGQPDEVRDAIVCGNARALYGI
jgi:predicted TIM-barrel fold metal-dependent hydrolase